MRSFIFFVLAPFLPQHRRRKERPLCKLRQNGPQRALHGKCRCPRNSGQHRRHPQKIPARYRCAVWRGGPCFAKAGQRRGRSRHTNTPAGRKPSPARRSARIMPPLPSAPIQARSTKTHFGTPVCGPSRRRLSLFLLFFIPHGYNAEHAKTSSLHFSKAKARVRTETPAHSCPRPCRPWMQAAPTARRGCLQRPLDDLFQKLLQRGATATPSRMPAASSVCSRSRPASIGRSTRP